MKLWRLTWILALGAATGALAAPAVIPAPPNVAAKGYILIDAATQKVLVEHNSDEQLPPASLTKILTSYIAAVEVASGRVALDDAVPISVKAWRTPGSRMFIREGTTVPLGDLLKGVIIQSGNDASVAIAEYIAGSEGAFADMMNQHALQLGMTGSQFQNATGLPNDEHYSTARDMVGLTRSLIERFPDHYRIYAERSFTFNDIEQPNRNRLLWRDRTVDGVKTGHTDAAGYCLVASAVRDGMRLISAVMGTDSDEARMRESQKLLSYGFRYFETQTLYDETAPLKTSEVWYGEADEVSMGVAAPVSVTIPRGRYEDLKATLDIPLLVEAPIAAGDILGELRVTLDDEVVVRAPLIARESVEQAGFFTRLGHGVYLFFRELFG